jgi:hypothetical protein
MKKIKIQLSGFDIGMIIAFVVVTLIGVGAWWYLSGVLQDAQAKDASVKTDYDTYSVKNGIVVNPANVKNLQANSDVLKAKVDPVIATYLLPKENKLRGVDKEDPVAWKKDLDDGVHALNALAKSHNVIVPNNYNYYFGFSRYLSTSPSDEQTAVLTKQRLGITEIADILINDQVKGIDAVRRTYEEDPHTAGSAPSSNSNHADAGDQLSGYAVNAVGNAYVAYPFEIQFDATAETLRPVIDDLVKSPYLFVIRTVEVHNSNPNSPQLTDLDKMAGTTPGASSLIGSAPGDVAASTPTKGPQHLFGDSTLTVKLRLDMIEWNPAVKNTDPAPAKKP